MLLMNKIYIPIFSNAVRSKQFSINSGNPGIGGSQFTAIRMSIFLAQSRGDWEIVLVNYFEIDIENSPKNLKQEAFSNELSFFSSLPHDDSHVIISIASILKKVDIDTLVRLEKNLICWSRHPFDIIARELAAKVKFKGIVCVGTYQFHSNLHIMSGVYHIQNIFILPKLNKICRSENIDKQNVNVLYLGALTPGKGFLEIAKSWEKLKDSFPNIKLHVIGSSATYGSEPSSDLVPTTSDYALKILQYISKDDIASGRVIFYGNLGEEKFDVIQKCNVAILNPTGATEAFPASPLECMACGIPVIASDDYGMSDSMRFFPELVINKKNTILARVEWLFKDPLRYREIQQRSICVANWFDSQTDQIITRWIRVIEFALKENSQELRLHPIMPFYGSGKRLFFRRDVRPTLSTIKRFPNKISKLFKRQSKNFNSLKSNG